MAPSTRRAAAVAVAATLLSPAFASAQSKPSMSWQPASSSNQGGVRSTAQIRYIVIHKVEGSLDSCVSWFKNPAARVSAHYVVDEGEIVQCVQDTRKAWHAGNTTYNNEAIAIENAGYTFKSDVNDAHYRRLGSLVAYLCRTYNIPATRTHIIGHNEVPTPGKPGKFGGASQKNDPGPYFSWTTLIAYVQQAMGGTMTVTPQPIPIKPAPTPGNGSSQAVSVSATTLNVRDGAWGTVIGTVSGSTAWVRTGATDQGFIEIYFRGAKAWISSTFVTGHTGRGAEVTSDDVNVRNTANLSSIVSGKAHTGQVYAAGDLSADGAWRTIQFDQQRRWVYKDYTREVSLHP